MSELEELELLFCTSGPEVQKAFSAASLEEINLALLRALSRVAQQFPDLLSSQQKEKLGLNTSTSKQKIFIACPCRICTSPEEPESWTKRVNAITKNLIEREYIVFSPLSMYGDTLFPPSYWRQLCLSMLSWADALVILPEKEWENHPEVQDWMVRARIQGLPVMTLTKDMELDEFLAIHERGPRCIAIP